MAELDAQRPKEPTDEQYQNLVDSAPDDISEDVSTAVDILREQGDAAAGTPLRKTAAEAVFSYQEANCDGASGGG